MNKNYLIMSLVKNNQHKTKQKEKKKHLTSSGFMKAG